MVITILSGLISLLILYSLLLQFSQDFVSRPSRKTSQRHIAQARQGQPPMISPPFEDQQQECCQCHPGPILALSDLVLVRGADQTCAKGRRADIQTAFTFIKQVDREI